MNTIQTGILNDTFKQAKDCITAPITDTQSFSVGDIIKICKDLFIPIQNIYYHITCLTEDTSLFPQSLSEQCKGYLEKLDNDTTAESTFHIYGSKLQNHIVETNKYTEPCKVEDCNVILNDTVNQITKMFTQDSTMNSTSLSTKSDSNVDVYAMIFFVACLTLIWGCICWSVKDFFCDNETTAGNNKNIELVADHFSNTENLLNNDHAENKHEEIVELIGDSQVTSV